MPHGRLCALCKAQRCPAFAEPRAGVASELRDGEARLVTTKFMKVLAIETSCDETGIALVEGTKTSEGFAFETKKAALLSQALLHSPYGGVYPNLAKREHQKNLPALFEQFANEEFDAVAVTHGPGLEPALWTGIEFAKKVAAEKNVPLLPTNHMEGHLISSLAQPSGEHSNILQNVRMSVLALLISGGHTEFVLMKEWLQYEIIGKTLDDAVGEAFDKVARMLGLPYPGGPEISKLAAQARKKLPEKGEMNTTPTPFSGTFSVPKLPRPMINSGTCDFSFSGLKTAALYALRDRGGIQKLSNDEIAAFAAELEDAIADVMVSKTRQALEQTNAQTFVIGGGVAANRYIREKLQALVLEEFPDIDLRLPQLSITGDNAIMIAQAALARALSGLNDTAGPELRAVGNLSIAS
ncbi:tRNA (adenosine(37)-N6)-threonylcarbamoyltransferase complex transferase subunit TsaD [Candidatus Kaiserbacteria bacterium]|nr:tRNA (adenosine(37)-N6)-threonylcarbamoyltransferase complex transferase subunit TsaD [Candidatus Kaiserbacteria bacterium]